VNAGTTGEILHIDGGQPPDTEPLAGCAHAEPRGTAWPDLPGRLGPRARRRRRVPEGLRVTSTPSPDGWRISSLDHGASDNYTLRAGFLLEAKDHSPDSGITMILSSLR
jgi:hypothetical protein